MLEIIFVFLFVDLFDNTGTLIALAHRGGFMRPDGTVPRLHRALMADSGAAMLGAAGHLVDLIDEDDAVLLGALQRNDLPFEFIQVRHEEMAAFMATAYAKFTGEVGVCLATSGPGATHLLTGMYDAYSDHVPLLAIAGQQARNVNGAHYQQELDLTSVYKDVAAYVQQAASPASVRHIVDRAMRIAKAERKVAAIILPNDLQDVPYEAPVRKHGNTFSGVGYTMPRVVPFDADLRLLVWNRTIARLTGASSIEKISDTAVSAFSPPESKLTF